MKINNKIAAAEIIYIAPECRTMEIYSEGVLCESNGGGSTEGVGDDIDIFGNWRS